MLTAFSGIVLEDAETLDLYSPAEMADVRAAIAAVLDSISHEGPAILTHNDLHIFNVFVEPDDRSRSERRLRVGKLFDFGLSLFQADYLSCFGQFGFGGKESEVSRRFHVSERELRGYHLVSELEFVNFANVIRFAPDQPYGCEARRVKTLSACRAYLDGECV